MRVYLDHNATTPVRDEVVEAMTRVLRDGFGNPSSTHAEGTAARAELERAREQVARLLVCAPDDVLFTAGATEANNTALLGVLAARGGAPGHVVSSTVEHPSVEASLEALEARGWRVTRVGVDADGRVEADVVEAAFEPDTAMVSLIWANNETGALQPVERVAEFARARGVLVHTDATQRVGKLPIDLSRVPADLLSLSAHKLGGAKGVGALVVRSGLAFEPLLRGGPQERRRRGGTENVPGVVGLGVACALAAEELPKRAPELARLRDRLWQGICAKVPRVRRNGPPDAVLPNTLNLEFEGTAGELLLQALDLEGVAASAGAACASGSIEPSSVLLAMGRSPAQARASLRLSVGFGVDAAQIDHVLAILPDLVERARRAGDV
jgi:cysteine desulfurase